MFLNDKCHWRADEISNIYTAFHTLKSKASLELYVRLCPAGLFRGRPWISFVSITACYTTERVNHKDFKTALQSSTVTWPQSRPMYKAAQIQTSPSSPWDGQTGCEHTQHFLKTVTDFLSVVSWLKPCCKPLFHRVYQWQKSLGRSMADTTVGAAFFPSCDIQRTESPSDEGSVLSAH